MTEDCLFCKIVRGEAPSTKVYEDEDFVAFQALFQTTKGHTLLVPKEHSTDISEMKPELGTKMLELIQYLGSAQEKGLGADGFNIGVNKGKEAGQVIFHTHIHIIPRYKDDGLVSWGEQETSEEDRVLYAEKIIKELD
mgnify:CR=1 FL=1